MRHIMKIAKCTYVAIVAGPILEKLAVKIGTIDCMYYN